MARTDHQHIRDWLKALGSLAACALTAKEFDARISAYVPLLATDFPRSAFGPASLAAIARQCKFFPAYAELCDLLSAWWREHRPPPRDPALEGPETRTQAERSAMAEASWRDITAGQVRERIAEIRLVEGAGHIQASLGRMLAHAITTHAPHHLGLLPPDWQPDPGGHPPGHDPGHVPGHDPGHPGANNAA